MGKNGILRLQKRYQYMSLILNSYGKTFNVLNKQNIRRGLEIIYYIIIKMFNYKKVPIPKTLNYVFYWEPYFL